MSKRRNRKRTLFEESAYLNNETYIRYVEKLTELSISMFKWKNLPSTIDARYIELELFRNGSVIYFTDEVMGDLCLDCISQGELSVYGEPRTRRAYSRYNQYQKDLTEKDSVIIWNNLMRTNSIIVVSQFARRLYNYDRIIDVNTNAQKTPGFIQGTEKQRLTLLNMYKEYDGNAPFIFGDTNVSLDNLKYISTGAPYISDKIFELKTQTWNEALTYLGISNVNINKKERLITDEVTRNQGGTIASRYSRLESRQEGARKINDMFDTNISVEYREDWQDVDISIPSGGREDE